MKRKTFVLDLPAGINLSPDKLEYFTKSRLIEFLSGANIAVEIPVVKNEEVRYGKMAFFKAKTTVKLYAVGTK